MDANNPAEDPKEEGKGAVSASPKILSFACFV
jgi:hypothetical protein